MHSGSVVCLAVFIFLSGLPFGAAQNTSSPARQAGQNEIRISVPTRLRIERTPGVVTVKVDGDSLKPVKLTIDQGMVVGYKSELRVYPAGKSRPALAQRSGVTGGTDFDSGDDILNAGDRNFPLPNKKYIVEIALTFFETDVHPGHMWQPWESKKYKALLRRTLVGSVE
jgi:hypothetical protein